MRNTLDVLFQAHEHSGGGDRKPSFINIQLLAQLALQAFENDSTRYVKYEINVLGNWRWKRRDDIGGFFRRNNVELEH